MAMPNVVRIDGCVMVMADAGDLRATESLTDAERCEYAAMVTDHARADYRASRLAAKCAVAHVREPDDDGEVEALLGTISVLRRPHARADVLMRSSEGGWSSLPLTLSLSHRDGRSAAAAAGPGVRVGVDVERMASIAYDHLRYFATEDERRFGPRSSSSLWALKEAAWKAMDMAPESPFHALELRFTEAREVCAVRASGREYPAHSMLLRPWGRTHVVALVIVGAPS